jgi:glycine/D-amino acid oxidase-like deaminating enzyme
VATTDTQTIVIGAGAIGSATAYWLAERGQTDVLVLEQ